MRLVKEITTSKRLFHLGVILACIAFAVPLTGYVITGSFMRYNGDDYCYASVLTKVGFWKAQWISYLEPQAYNGNRYSLTFFSGLSGVFGPYMNGVLPGLVIIIWLSGMFFVIRRITLFFGLPINQLETLLLGESLIFFSLYMAPSLSQILYWRSGMLPYLAPLIANTFLLSYIIGQDRNKIYKPIGLAIIGFLAILAGGFSEASSAVQLGYLTVLLVAILLIPQHRIEWRKSALQALSVAWIFSLVAMLLLALSPANEAYLLKSSRPDLISFFTISIRSALSFVFESIISLPLPTAILFIFSSGISWLIFSHSENSFRSTPFQWAKSSILILLVSILLILCSTAPSAFIQSAYPELRSLITARFIIILAIAGIGSITGLMISNLSSAHLNHLHFIRLGVMMMVGILCLYPIYSARNIYRDIPKYQRWAAFWDERDRELRLAKKSNTMDVKVVEIDHIIPSVSDLSADPRFWYNACAAGYYGLHSISADQPGWDSP